MHVRCLPLFRMRWYTYLLRQSLSFKWPNVIFKSWNSIASSCVIESSCKSSAFSFFSVFTQGFFSPSLSTKYANGYVLCCCFQCRCGSNGGAWFDWIKFICTQICWLITILPLCTRIIYVHFYSWITLCSATTCKRFGSLWKCVLFCQFWTYDPFFSQTYVLFMICCQIHFEISNHMNCVCVKLKHVTFMIKTFTTESSAREKEKCVGKSLDAKQQIWHGICIWDFIV